MSLAALAFARAGVENGFARPLTEGLDRLPLEVLSASGPHRPTLARLGCKTLSDVRRPPRGGVSRRFDKELLSALNQAYGLRTEAHAWVELPEQLRARLELMSRVELAPAMMFGARRLILQMCGWLAARHSGAGGFVLRWAHDAMSSKWRRQGDVRNLIAERLEDLTPLFGRLATDSRDFH
jgi:protein ImuB